MNGVRSPISLSPFTLRSSLVTLLAEAMVESLN